MSTVESGRVGTEAGCSSHSLSSAARHRSWRRRGADISFVLCPSSPLAALTPCCRTRSRAAASPRRSSDISCAWPPNCSDADNKAQEKNGYNKKQNNKAKPKNMF